MTKPIEVFPLNAVLIAADGVLANDNHETRKAYGNALLEWATATKRVKTSRVWEYARLLKDPETQSDFDAIGGSRGY